jgi:hypothetical protein
LNRFYQYNKNACRKSAGIENLEKMNERIAKTSIEIIPLTGVFTFHIIESII